MKLIQSIQKHLESIYGIKLGTSALDYLINHQELLEILPQHQHNFIPKELFLVNPQPENDILEIALFFDTDLQQNLTTHDPLEGIHNANLSDFCTLIEGVSHFVYYLHKAHLQVEVTQLELELQAEIDKFLLLALNTDHQNGQITDLLDMLFEDYSLHAELNDEEVERYQTASNLARKYCYTLSQQIKNKQIPAAIKEARRFYTLSQTDKIRHIIN